MRVVGLLHEVLRCCTCTYVAVRVPSDTVDPTHACLPSLTTCMLSHPSASQPFIVLHVAPIRRLPSLPSLHPSPALSAWARGRALCHSRRGPRRMP